MNYTCECLTISHALQAALATSQEQLERQAAAAAAQQGQAAAQIARVEGGVRELLGALAAEVPGLPAATQDALLGGSSSRAAAQQVAHAVEAHVEHAEACAADAVLAALEAELQPANAGAASAAASRLSPRKLLSLSPARRQQQAAGGGAVPSAQANEERLVALLGRSRELLSQLHDGEAAVAQLRGQVAALEAAAADSAHKFEQVRAACSSACGELPAAR